MQLHVITTGTTIDMANTNRQSGPISIPECVVRNEVSLLSWNIHVGLDSREGPKSEQEDFAKILSNSSVFCLQETKRDINFPNYRCFNQLRKSSRSGGLCIGVHRSLSENVKPLQTNYEDIQAVSITPDPSDPSTKFTLINVYDSPENSSFKYKRKLIDHDQLTTLEQLTEFIAKNNLGQVVLVGDFNARTRNLNHEFEQADDFEQNSGFKSHPVESSRSSRDRVINARGKLLIDLMACANLTILNGNMLGDIFGDFTCQNYRGSSLVDYIAVSENLFNLIERFEVLDLTSYSDHRPCKCLIKMKNHFISPEGILDGLEDAPIKHKWNAESGATSSQFRAVQSNEEFKQKITNLANSNTTCVTLKRTFMHLTPLLLTCTMHLRTKLCQNIRLIVGSQKSTQKLSIALSQRILGLTLAV